MRSYKPGKRDEGAFVEPSGRLMSTLKSTIVGGIMFLWPFGLLILAVTDVFDLALAFATPIADLFPKDAVFGVALIHLVVWMLIHLVCFVADFAVRYIYLTKVSAQVEAVVSAPLPGYIMTKTKVAGTLAQKYGAVCRLSCANSATCKGM